MDVNIFKTPKYEMKLFPRPNIDSAIGALYKIYLSHRLHNSEDDLRNNPIKSLSEFEKEATQVSSSVIDCINKSIHTEKEKQELEKQIESLNNKLPEEVKRELDNIHEDLNNCPSEQEEKYLNLTAGYLTALLQSNTITIQEYQLLQEYIVK